jgi:hypothetical protein
MPRYRPIPHVAQQFLAVLPMLERDQLTLRVYPEPRRVPQLWFVRVGSYIPLPQPSLSSFISAFLRLCVKLFSSLELSTLNFELLTAAIFSRSPVLTS